MVLNLEEDNVGAVLLGSQHNINEGDTVKTTGRVVEVPAGRTCGIRCHFQKGSGYTTADRYQSH